MFVQAMANRTEKILYSVDKASLENENELPHFVTAKFDFDESGTTVELGFFTDGCKSEQDILNKALKTLANFNRVKLTYSN